MTSSRKSVTGEAAPAQSALTLRLVLAAFGLLVCTGLAVWLLATDAPPAFAVVLLLQAATAVIDLAVILRRKRRGERG